MGNIASVSHRELRERRLKLRRQRRWRGVQLLWQTLAIGGMAGGLLWGTTQPIWLIQGPEQVQVVGNRLLSHRKIVGLLALPYPQSLWQIQPQDVAQKLEEQGPIVAAQVSRQLFPPSLMIEVQERQPVAIAQKPAPTPLAPSEMGWLDAQGNWMPWESYTNLENSSLMPTLKVIGSVRDYGKDWPEFYQILSQSAVNIFEIDWQNPGNLILTTELGKVHLGPFSPQFAQQLQVLDQMRQLPKYMDTSKIAYLDLRDPGTPMVQLPNSSAQNRTGSEGGPSERR